MRWQESKVKGKLTPCAPPVCSPKETLSHESGYVSSCQSSLVAPHPRVYNIGSPAGSPFWRRLHWRLHSGELLSGTHIGGHPLSSASKHRRETDNTERQPGCSVPDPSSAERLTWRKQRQKSCEVLPPLSGISHTNHVRQADGNTPRTWGVWSISSHF